ncbi:tRNA lysidine(34) synthetase TilS [Treponema rectale]|uniref:tRNA(Ile)-lysidine synthase n=1 Tax=Treponema rectale TaxID=744512 RepID=A0A840SB17_9SPIR|nr:tRNA lysidine(34) synthetase TilS [Treponema rectale]MBB5217900.1 tRNA(Ile)-lysidine synthase [Treponema rectale]QOS40379.1 tRNA lysidine(34) synthetase TilS [Treponema rectale]
MIFQEQDFIQLVKKGLFECGVDLSADLRVGVAVSGGADSVSLLYSLSEIFTPEQVFAVTVNHNLRPEEETCGDADFVEETCRSLGIKCRRTDVQRGLVKALAEKRGMGVEEAARKVRYEVFEDFIKSEKLDYLCLAHNKNDAGETMLMRFLKGSGIEGLCSVPRVRGRIIRPLLDVTRSQIESFLLHRGISYRTDSTNFDSAMTRNFLRNEVIPLLEKNMSGWRNAVLLGAEKIRGDEDFIQCELEKAFEVTGYKAGEIIEFDAESYSALHEALRRRIILDAVKRSGPDSLVSHDFIMEADGNIRTCRSFSCEAGGICIRKENGRVYVGVKKLEATETGFSVIIEKEGSFSAGDYFIEAGKSDDAVHLICNGKEIVLDKLEFPFAFRSFQVSDRIRKADGTYKNVSRILDDFKAGALKEKVPVVQQLFGTEEDGFMSIRCIFGSVAGLKDWIVKE